MDSDKVFQDFMNIFIRITQERIDHVIESHPEMKNYTNHIQKGIKLPDFIYYSENSSYYILIKKFDDFIGENLILYIKKTNVDGFIISCHPISNKRLDRTVKNGKHSKNNENEIRWNSDTKSDKWNV